MAITRRTLARALAKARAKAGTPSEPSGVSRAARVGDALALYAAPVEDQGLEPQGALGAGSVTDDLLSGKSNLADRDALESELSALPPGPHDLLINFAIADADTRRTWRRTERRTIWISASDSPAERASKAARQMQTVARDVVKEASKLLVRMAGALLIPSDDSVTVETGIMNVRELPPEEPVRRGGGGTIKRRDRSDAARRGWETRRKRAEAAERAKAALAQERAAERARRQAAARKAAATRKRNAAAAARAAAARSAAARKGWETRKRNAAKKAKRRGRRGK